MLGRGLPMRRAEKEKRMSDDENPLNGAEFEAALGKLQAGTADPKALALLVETLRDAVLDLQKQLEDGGDDEDEEEGDEEDEEDDD